MLVFTFQLLAEDFKLGRRMGRKGHKREANGYSTSQDYIFPVAIFKQAMSKQPKTVKRLLSLLERHSASPHFAGSLLNLFSPHRRANQAGPERRERPPGTGTFRTLKPIKPLRETAAQFPYAPPRGRNRAGARPRYRAPERTSLLPSGPACGSPPGR